MKLVRAAILLLFVFAVVFVSVGVSEARGGRGNILEELEELNAPGGAYEGQFDIVLAALQAADPIAVEQLTGRRPRTFFAPTDDAWPNIPPGVVGLPTSLDDFSNSDALTPETLTEVLLYSTARGRQWSFLLRHRRWLLTLQGSFITISDGKLYDVLGREANLIDTNIKAKNGLIHVVDSVLLPFPP